MTPERDRVVVVGGGFAGLKAVKALAGAEANVTIVDQHNFHTFQPLLYEVATAGMEPADVAYPIRTIFGRQKNVMFRHGLVVGIDTEKREVKLDGDSALPYDYLVVATGAAAGFLGVTGAAQNSRPLYTLADARRLRNDLLLCLEQVDSHPERFDGGAPVFVVVGGGPTGVETAGALMELIDVTVKRDGLKLDRERTRIILLDAADRLLTAFRPTGSKYAEQTLENRHVDIRLEERVAAITPNGVKLQSGEEIKAALVVWAGGVTVSGTLADSLPGPRTRGGRIQVEPDLSLPGHPEIFVVGDAAAVPVGGKSDEITPQLAPVAIQSGHHAGRQIVRRIAGEPPQPFRYVDKGIMATIGRRAAVAQLPVGPIIRGTLGWLAWLGLHLVYLIGFRNRIQVLINWAWRYLDWTSGPRLIMGDVERESDVEMDSEQQSAGVG
ncbi:MAG TPA: NAD(P)/FAD-dependent oxidoreductase [Acidimicrobiales bacterium]|nr:NAD(P)/FAD-dependent oxidoreductase [Acidimicrobiales bacterium]